MANTPTNDVDARSDLLGQAEALERLAGGLRLKAEGSEDFPGYDHTLVVRAVDWDDAAQMARGEAAARGVMVVYVQVLWALGAGVYRVRVTGVMYPHRHGYMTTLAAA